ncbi:hypothetical protein ARMGADRAFT_393323 [Armillaria gallica]|uniref:Uncharacterized protein n=1 Tax=Armillaria gallica TaxID=47427 RepID=A0A2H3DZY4_ARMGA|nr:hypothetical protein ARMGADRAFT_393323 [Armillaria gallica]
MFKFVRRSLSTCRIREPPSHSSRIAPTPLVFVSASKWDPRALRMPVHASFFLDKGFTCIEVDISPPEPSSPQNSADLMNYFEAELQGTMRLSMIPFPPVFFARHAASLIVQTYISSNPASALLPTPLEEFNFEPHFPIAIISELAEMERLRANNRLARTPGVETIVASDVDGHDAFSSIERWFDALGI